VPQLTTEVQSIHKAAADVVLERFAHEIVEMCSGDFEEAENQLRYRLRREREKWFDVTVGCAR